MPTPYIVHTITLRFSLQILDNLQEVKYWLDTRTEPWEEIIIKWRQTIILRKQSRAANVSDFINEWPSLKLKNAHTLVKFNTIL